MTNFSIQVAHLLPVGQRADARSFPTLSYAVQAVAEAAHAHWVAYALGQAPLPNGKTIYARDGNYARSIMLRQTGDFAAEVYSDLPYADQVENGEPARDLKKMLNTSHKVRRTASGKRYLIIPFRWSTQGKGGIGANVMPAAVANWWKAQTPSSVVGMGVRTSGLHASDVKTKKQIVVPQRRYKWGTKLDKGDMSRLGIRGTAARKTMNGMYNFRKPGGKGGGAHSTFITFRTMMEGSSGWITRPKPGQYPARTTAAIFKPVAEEAFRKAIEEDLKRIFDA